MKRVNQTPALPRPDGAPNTTSLARFDIVLVKSLFDEFMAHAQRLNGAITADGADAMQAPLSLAPYAVASLPTSARDGSIAFASDASGGAVPVYRRGSDWLRFDNNTVVT